MIIYHMEYFADENLEIYSSQIPEKLVYSKEENLFFLPRYHKIYQDPP